MNPYQMPKVFCIGERVGLPAQRCNSRLNNTYSTDIRTLLFCVVTYWCLCRVLVRHVQLSTMAITHKTFSCLVRKINSN